MKNKLLTTIFVFMFFSGLATRLSAQIEQFKLSDYKLPELKRQGIDFTFNLNGSQSKTDFLGELGEDSNNKYFSNGLDGTYFFYKNSEKYQGEHSISLNGGYSLSNSKRDELSKNYDETSNASTDIRNTNRFYFGNQFYFGLSTIASLSYRKNGNERTIFNGGNPDSRNFHRNNSSNYSVSVPISFGKGRIERVEDARQTIYILKELKRNSRLSRELSNDKILQLASMISKIKNERVLDARLKKIYELKQLDSVLQSMNLLNESDIVYFTSTNDMWEYGDLQQRNAGHRFSIQYTPGYGFRKSEDERVDNNYTNNTDQQVTSTRNYKSFENSVALFYILEKPFKQQYQHTFSSWMSYGISNIKTENIYQEIQFNDTTEVNNNDKLLAVSINYIFGIYPNSRTSFSIGSMLFWSKTWNDETIEDIKYKYDYQRLNEGVFANLNYYFSPKLRLGLYYRFTFLHGEPTATNDSEYNDFHHTARVSLNYSIF